MLDPDRLSRPESAPLDWDRPTDRPVTGAQRPEAGLGGGRWVGLFALLAVACCAVPLLLAAGVFAGVGVGGIAGGLVAVVAVAAAGVVLVRRRRRERGCGQPGARSCGCGQADATGDDRA